MTKKLFTLLLALALALPILGLAAEALPEAAPADDALDAAPWGGQRGRYARRAPRTGYLDQNNDGICDNCGQAQGQDPDVPGFVDEDKDGVCDNCGAAQQAQAGRQGRRGGMMRGFGRGQAQGRGFLDEDKDGVCDHSAAGGQGQGFGRGCCGGQGRLAPGQRNARPGRQWGPGRR